MKRKTVNDFDGGINNIDDPELIPDSTLTEAENYEYRDYDGLKKRKSVDISELTQEGLTDVENFDIWYPGRSLSDMAGDKIYVIHQKESTIEIPLFHAPVALDVVLYDTDYFVAIWQAYPYFEYKSYWIDVSEDETFKRYITVDGIYYNDYPVYPGESVIVSPVTRSTTYYYRIRVAELSAGLSYTGNVTPYSNTITVTTL